MKAALALLALGAAAVLTVFVLAVVRTHDDVSDDLTTCIQNGDAAVVRGTDLLGPLRADLANDAPPRVVKRYALGDNRAVLLEGTGYRVLALDGRGGPRLDGDLALRIYDRTADFALVAVERDPLTGVLAGCAALEE